MPKINIIPLRSSIGAADRQLDQEQADYLGELNAALGVSFSVNEDADIHFFFIETGGTEEAFLRCYNKYSPPYYLLTTKRRNSLPAALEIGAYLGNQKLAYHILHGSLDQVASVMRGFIQKRIENSTPSIKPSSPLAKTEIENRDSALDEKKNIESANPTFRLGVIGRPSDWLIASQLDRQYAKEKMQIAIIDIDYAEFTAEIDKKSYDSSEKIRHIQKKLENNEYLEGALHIYGAIKRLILTHDLHGFSIRCFDLLGSYRNTACLALALLNEEGISAGCEGDLPLLLGMHLVRRMLDLDSFQANPSSADALEKTITFAHCTVPLSMCQKHGFMTHFESGLGIGIRGEMKLGPCTIFRLSGNLRKALIEEGQIIANLTRDDLCRTQIVIRMEEGLEKILSNPLGNHHLIIYGHHKASLSKSLSTIDKSLELV